MRLTTKSIAPTMQGKTFKIVAQARNRKGKNHVIDIPEGAPSTYLKVTVSKTCGQARLLLRQIKIYAPKPDPVVESTGPDEILFSATDPGNPLHVFRLPITRTIARLSERLLQGQGDLTPHQKVVLFMDFMSDFKVGEASRADPETTVRERIGACGTFCNVLVALAKTQGIEGRIIHLGNFPEGNGHAVAELLIEGKWSVYDPTYAAYYTDTLDDQRSPNVLSFDELRKGRGDDPKVSVVVRNKERLERGKPTSYDFLGPDIYRLAQPAGQIGPENPLVFPLSLDVLVTPRVDNSEFGGKYQGARYVGAADTCVFQEWSLGSLVPGEEYEFVIVPDWLGGEILGEFRATAGVISGGKILEGAAASFWPGQEQQEPWRIRFRADSSVARILLSHPYRGPEFHYVNMREYRIEKVSGR